MSFSNKRNRHPPISLKLTLFFFGGIRVIKFELTMLKVNFMRVCHFNSSKLVNEKTYLNHTSVLRLFVRSFMDHTSREA